MNSQLSPIKTIDIKLASPEVSFYCSRSTKQIHAGGIYLIGFEFDGTACFRKGTRLGPNALRAVSDGIESYSPYLNDDLADFRFYDLGNLNITDYPITTEANPTEQKLIEAQWQNATNDFETLFQDIDLGTDQVKVMTLGGEHSISFAPISKYLSDFEDLVVIHLDAHADLRDGYLGHHYSHASIIRRVLDRFSSQHELIQYGIRSGTKAEYEWMKNHDTLVASRQQFLQKIESIAAERPIYLTLDLDYFDPSFFPGTGTPEPGGEDFHSFVSLCKVLMNKNLVGCDVVELSPELDSSGNSSVFAAKVVRELLMCLKGKIHE